MLRPVTRLIGAVCAVLVVALLSGCSGSSGGSPRSDGLSSASTSAAATPTATTSPTATSTPASDAATEATTSAPAPPATETTAAPPSSEPAPVAGSPVVVLNPGHNGGNSSRPDLINAQVPAGNGTTKACDTAGTTSVDGYPEHAFAFDVAGRVAAILTARGVRVELTRADDESVGPCVDDRAALGNGPDVAAVVSIHADGAAEDGHGFHVSQASIPPAGPDIAAQSDRLTTAVHDAMAAQSGLSTSTYLGSDGYFPRSDLAGLNLAQRPTTFLECGNMKNPGDAALFAAPEGRQQIAEAIAAGILTYLAG